MTHLTASQIQILSYIMSAGGNEHVGITAAEIVEATHLSRPTVFRVLRENMPGIRQCISKSVRNNSAMYFATPQTVAEDNITAITEQTNKAIALVKRESSIGVPLNETKNEDKDMATSNDKYSWLNAFPKQHSDIMEQAWANITKEQPSFNRIAAIVTAINNPPADILENEAYLRRFYITAGLTLAGIARITPIKR